MNSPFKNNLGWLAAAALAGVLVFSGFQSAQEKSAVVDMNRVIADSKLGKKNRADFDTMVVSREELLKYLDANRLATQEQAGKLRAFALKGAPLTEAERREDERIKGEIAAAMKAFGDLNQKQSPTDQERIQLQDFNQRTRTMGLTLNNWNQEFTEELSRKQAENRRTEIEKAREALSAVSKKGAYSVVFEMQVAPFGANDLTADAIKELDSKTP
jgi:Skp family chaperone for outer membrane proteins